MSKISELISSGANVSVTLATKDLQEFADYLIRKTKRDLEETITAEKSETYISVQTVGEMLDVDRSTLYRWAQQGYLKPIKVGGKNRYRMSDIKKIFEGGKKALQNS
ncbi:helix-turn-helix domain-containing protein [uncultured Draconibacterium sp.]|uniref:helix-turn-helix domain-containing protein n=1 Tax=uncultured Draconibacterium sp. TaxID=1573823 RepID=UPI0029C63DD0|nr:helix-turn-helix domain-containing protein [uncultured Draconibacterium sp.]